MADQNLVPIPASGAVTVDAASVARTLGRLSADATHLLPEAKDDIAVIESWIENRCGSPTTRLAYARAAGLLVFWAVSVAKRPISDLLPDDYRTFFAWLRDPPAEHINPRRSRRTRRCDQTGSIRTNEQWRPLAGPISERTARQVRTILNGMLEYMTIAGHLRANPLRLLGRGAWVVGTGAPAHQPVPEHRDPVGEFDRQLLAEQVEAMPRQTPSQRFAYHQSRWLLALLTLTGIRAHEVGRNTTNAFNSVRRGDEVEWFLRVVGKGARTRDIPVSPDLILELRIYRVALAAHAWHRLQHGHPRSQARAVLDLITRLPPMPGDTQEDRDHPLALAVGTDGEPLGYGGVYKRMDALKRAVLDSAAQSAQPLNGSDLKRISRIAPHAYRHGYATELLKQGASLVDVRDNLGHSSLNTTSRYVHSDLSQRAKSAAKLRSPTLGS